MMAITSEVKENELIIKLPEEFNFHCQSEFRQAYENKVDNWTKRIVLDFSQTRYIDSASLGMMLILREYVENIGNVQHNINLVNCTKDVLEILGVTNFEKLFVINN